MKKLLVIALTLLSTSSFAQSTCNSSCQEDLRTLRQDSAKYEFEIMYLDALSNYVLSIAAKNTDDPWYKEQLGNHLTTDALIAIDSVGKLSGNKNKISECLTESTKISKWTTRDMYSKTCIQPLIDESSNIHSCLALSGLPIFNKANKLQPALIVSDCVNIHKSSMISLDCKLLMADKLLLDKDETYSLTAFCINH